MDTYSEYYMNTMLFSLVLNGSLRIVTTRLTCLVWVTTPSTI